jgi:hypothetical protein
MQLNAVLHSCLKFYSKRVLCVLHPATQRNVCVSTSFQRPNYCITGNSSVHICQSNSKIDFLINEHYTRAPHAIITRARFLIYVALK